MNVTYPMGVLRSLSIKKIFYDKMDLRPFFILMWRSSIITFNNLKCKCSMLN